MLNVISMNLDLVRTFVVLGQSKSFAEVANKLNISYSQVVRHIKQLENIYGVKLVNNRVVPIELTEDGKLLFEGFERAFNELCLSEKNFYQSKNLNTGKITIGISSEIEEHIVNKKINEFKTKFPNVNIKILNLPFDLLCEKLKQYSIDLVIDGKIESLNKKDNIISKPVLKEKFGIIYDKKMESIRKLKDLNNKSLILPVSSKHERKLINELLKKNNVIGNVSLEVSNYNTAKEYARNKLGYAIVPEYMTDSGLIFYDLNINKEICVSYIKDNLSPTAKEFLNVIQETSSLMS